MDGFSLLEETIRSMPVPGAPPRLSLDGAAVGLSFLDTALRLNHVRRLTERISLADHRVARRITEVDVRLGMLDEGQRQASELFRSIASHSSEGADQKDGPACLASEIWVPVARISRTAAPVDVRDAAGRKLPRLTQYETSRLLASGLYRLLRGILTGFPDARREQRFTSTAVEIAPSKLCVGLEDAWKTALDETPGGFAVREVTVVWREFWLGHWAATSV